MLDTVRRHSNRITLCLLALCGAVLFAVVFKQARLSHRRPTAGPMALGRPNRIATQSYQQGLQALKERNEAASEQEFRRSLQADPQNPVVWLALADLLKQQGRSEEALLCYRTGVKPHSDWNAQRLDYWHMSGHLDPEAALRYAQLCDSLKYKQEADTAYTSVISAVEYKHVCMLQGAEWEKESSLKKHAYLAIAYWRDYQNRHADALPAYAKAGIPKPK